MQGGEDIMQNLSCFLSPVTPTWHCLTKTRCRSKERATVCCTPLASSTTYWWSTLPARSGVFEITFAQNDQILFLFRPRSGLGGAVFRGRAGTERTPRACEAAILAARFCGRSFISSTFPVSTTWIKSSMADGSTLMRSEVLGFVAVLLQPSRSSCSFTWMGNLKRRVKI